MLEPEINRRIAGLVMDAAPAVQEIPETIEEDDDN